MNNDFLACINSECPDFGKHILPPDSRFCPTCGRSILEEYENHSSMLNFEMCIGELNNKFKLNK